MSTKLEWDTIEFYIRFNEATGPHICLFFTHCVCVCVYIYFFLAIIIVNLFLNSFPLSPRNFLGPLIKILSSKITLPFTKLKIVYPKIVYSIFTNWKSSIKKSSTPILPIGKKSLSKTLLFQFYQMEKKRLSKVCSGQFNNDKVVLVLSMLI